MRIDIESGVILESMESLGHWNDMSDAGEIYEHSLTGNIFKWYKD